MSIDLEDVKFESYDVGYGPVHTVKATVGGKRYTFYERGRLSVDRPRSIYRRRDVRDSEADYARVRAALEPLLREHITEIERVEREL